MSNYIRPKIAGACIFFTVTLANRRSELLTREIAALRAAVRRTKAERPFTIEAWVVLPDHMHCVWTLPENDHDFSTRRSVIKARFSRPCPLRPAAPATRPGASMGSGSGGSGNITSAAMRTRAPQSAIAGSTRSNTGWPRDQRIGPIPRSTAMARCIGRRVRIHCAPLSLIGKDLNHTSAETKCFHRANTGGQSSKGRGKAALRQCSTTPAEGRLPPQGLGLFKLTVMARYIARRVCIHCVRFGEGPRAAQ